MLSYRAFTDKHANKFSREQLGNAEKRRRYEDYKQSYQANSNDGPRVAIRRRRRNEITPFMKDGGGNQKDSIPRNLDFYRTARRQLLTQYFLSVIDPWNHKAHIPDPLSYQGVPVSIKWQTIIKTDDKGAFMFMQRPGITRCYAVSANENDTAVFSSPTSYRNLTVVSSTSNFYFANLDLTTKTTNDQLIETCKDVINAYTGALGGQGGMDCATFQSIPSWQDIRTTAVAYRVVSGGTRLNYIGPPLTAKGSVALAPYHSAYGLTGDGSGATTFPNVLNFTNVSTLEGAQIRAAVDGCEIVHVPYGMDFRFRPTKQENGFSKGAVQLQANDIICVPDFAACDVDVDEYDSLFAPAATVISAVAADTLAYEGSAMEPAVFGLASGNTYAGYHMMAGRYQDHRLPSDMTSLIVAGSGLDESTEVFRVEHVLNVEVIPDSRAFSAVSIENNDGLGSLDHPLIPAGHSQAAARMAGALPPIPKDEGGNGIAPILHAIAEAIPQALHTMQHTLPHLKKLGEASNLVEVATTIADIVEVIAA